MSFSLEFLLTFLLILLTVVGLPALIVGWKRPKIEPRTTQFVVLGSILVFSAFTGFVPEFQRDWFTRGIGILAGLLVGFAGFVAIVNAAEYLRTYRLSTSFSRRVLKIHKGR